MIQVEHLQNAIEQIVGVGNPIVLVGSLNSSKSTAIESLASSEDVQNILAMREEVNIPEVNIVITDFLGIPENCLIVIAKPLFVRDAGLPNYPGLQEMISKFKRYGLKLPTFEPKYMFAFDKDTMKDSAMAEIAHILMNPKERLLEDVTLVFRGRENLFKADGIDSFTVMEDDGKKVHSIRFIDTQEIFSEDGASSVGEVSRIHGAITSNDSNKIVFVLNADYSSFAVDADNALCKFLEDMDKELDVYLLYTHLDVLLSNLYARTNKYKHGGDKIDWSTIYKIMKESLDNRAERFEDALKFNNLKRKPMIRSSYYAAYTSPIAAVNDLFRGDGISYFEAMDRLVADVASGSEGKAVKGQQMADMSIF